MCAGMVFVRAVRNQTRPSKGTLMVFEAESTCQLCPQGWRLGLDQSVARNPVLLSPLINGI
jgi:hypothetical protein